MRTGCCGKRRDELSKPVGLRFGRDELLYDIGNYAYVEGDVMPAKDEHARHQVFDVTQEGNVDIATRILNLAHSEVTEMLYPYTKERVDADECYGDELEEPETYVIDMKVPENFSRTSLKFLRQLVHEYMVYRVLYEWMGLANLGNPGSRQIWHERLEGIRTQIKSAVRWRTGPLRLGRYPF